MIEIVDFFRLNLSLGLQEVLLFYGRFLISEDNILR